MKLFFRALIGVLVIGGAIGAVPGPLFAQEAAAPVAPPVTAEPSTADAAPANATEPVAPLPDRAGYDAAVEKWREVTVRYTTLAFQWHSAKPSAADDKMRQQWGDVQGENREAMDDTVREATRIVRENIRAYPDVTVFLLQSVIYRASIDWYEQSGPAVDALLSAGDDTQILLSEAQINPGPLYRLAGVSFFATGELERAEHYLKLAEQAGTLREKDEPLLGAIPYYRPIWEQERAARQRDEQQGDLPRVRLYTSRGPVEIELFEDLAPNTVANFIQLVESGFYDHNNFYQVLRGIMAMTGDPTGDGNGTANHFIADENEHPDKRPIVRGTLVMAKLPNPNPEATPASLPNTASSQFIIAMMPLPGFTETHTVFGRVVSGMGAVSALTPVNITGEKSERNVVPDQVFRAEVLRKRDHAYEPKKLEVPFQ